MQLIRGVNIHQRVNERIVTFPTPDHIHMRLVLKFELYSLTPRQNSLPHFASLSQEKLLDRTALILSAFSRKEEACVVLMSSPAVLQSELFVGYDRGIGSVSA